MGAGFFGYLLGHTLARSGTVKGRDRVGMKSRGVIYQEMARCMHNKVLRKLPTPFRAEFRYRTRRGVSMRTLRFPKASRFLGPSSGKGGKTSKRG